MSTPVSLSQVSASIVSDVHEMLTQLWGIHTNNTSTSTYRVPCNHPCSLMRADMPKLNQKYWVSPKVDGVRTFLLFSFTSMQDYAVFVDRAGNITPCPVSMPLDAYSGTLLDGELVRHNDGSTTYLVFDAIAVNGYCMTRKPASERMAAVVRTVASIQMHANVSPTLDIRTKRWFPRDSSNLSEVSRSVGDIPVDGFIFVPEIGAPLYPGQQRDHFKWKPAEHHTIDMLWRHNALYIENFGVPELASSTLGVIHIIQGDLDGQVEDGAVVECAMSPVIMCPPDPVSTWTARFVRIRHDKLHANDIRIARLTLQNIVENILLHELQ